MRPKLRYVKIAGFILFVALLLDVVAGAILIPKMGINIRTFHPYYHHGLKENKHSTENWTHTKKYEMFTNSLGLRDESCRIVKLQTDKQTDRIVFIGDSFTEGVGVPYNKTFVGIVDNTLKVDNTEVFNAGVISYSAMTYYLKIRYLIENIGLKFNELYVFYDLSDPYNDYFHEKIEQFVPHDKEPAISSFKRKLLSFIGQHSYIMHSYNIIYPYVKYRKYEKGFPWWTLKEDVYNDWARQGLGISAVYIQKLVDLCKKNNIKVTIAVYPWTNLIEAQDLHSKLVLFWEDFTNRNNIAFLNYFPDFINETPSAQIVDKYFQPGDVHWNEEGHRLIAKKIIVNRNSSDRKRNN